MITIHIDQEGPVYGEQYDHAEFQRSRDDIESEVVQKAVEGLLVLKDAAATMPDEILSGLDALKSATLSGWDRIRCSLSAAMEEKTENHAEFGS